VDLTVIHIDADDDSDDVQPMCDDESQQMIDNGTSRDGTPVQVSVCCTPVCKGVVVCIGHCSDIAHSVHGR